MATLAFNRQIHRMLGHYARDQRSLEAFSQAREWYISQYAWRAIEGMPPEDIREFRTAVPRLSGRERELVLAALNQQI